MLVGDERKSKNINFIGGQEYRPSRFVVDLKKRENVEQGTRNIRLVSRITHIAHSTYHIARNVLSGIFSFFGNFFKNFIGYFGKAFSSFRSFVWGFFRAPLFSGRWFRGKIGDILNFFKPRKFFHEPKIIKEIESEARHNYERIGKRFSWHKIFKFAFLLFLIILPFKFTAYFKALDLSDLKSRVATAAESGLSNFKGAAESAGEMNFTGASADFSSASQDFASAQKDLDEVNGLLFSLAKYVPNDEVKLAGISKQILSAGQYTASLGQDFSSALDSLVNKETEDQDYGARLDNFTTHLLQAKNDAEQLNIQLKQIDQDSLPDPAQAIFATAKNKSGEISQAIDVFLNFAEKLKIFIGVGTNRRYLLIFQNNSELRASGGFIGSYARLDFINGRLEKVDIPGGGSYDTEGGLRRLVQAPKPLWLVNPLWHFWDANWWPDWPTTAKKLMWFYDKSDGPTVDGVISFTPTVMEKILKVTGPIDMTAKYGVVIDADNFFDTVQRITEAPNLSATSTEDLPDFVVDKKEPKKIIGDLFDQMMKELPERIKSREKMAEFFSVLTESMNEKQVLFYFNDENLEKEISNRGWGGEVLNTKGDYLSVINTNIAGQKSDRAIRETIVHSAEIMEDGSVVDTVKITREHTAEPHALFVGERNVDWLRVYVPAGSELLSASGFEAPEQKYFSQPDSKWEVDSDLAVGENKALIDSVSGTSIYQENGKTVFANWSMIDPGETAVIYLKYILPFQLEFNKQSEPEGWLDTLLNYFIAKPAEQLAYSLLVQKQPGSIGSGFSSILKNNLPSHAVWKYPENLPSGYSGWSVQDILSVDKYYAVVLEK